MKMERRGFTVVEVSLFLAITGLLFLGITVGVQNSIYQQRYTDAVQGFADFLRSAYSEVLNVQSTGSGNTERAVYGKAISFGGDEENEIVMYSIVGDINEGCRSETTLALQLSCLNADVFEYNGGAGSLATHDTITPFNIVEEYKPKWSTRIQKTKNASGNLEFSNYTGTIAIVRDPYSGKVKTMVLSGASVIKDEEGSFYKLWSSSSISSESNVDFCVNPNGSEASLRRADVRIVGGASNASGVEVIMDGEGNECRE